MAGIYIPDMTMPEHCGYCRFRYDGICHVLQKTKYSPSECPLVPVPDFGRLVDADAIRADIDAQRPGRSYEDAWALTVIDNAQTIFVTPRK